jgi:prepilin-type N-terminal cleavage/methylation domain-containing protein
MFFKRSQKAFTLVELIVVVAIIALLVGIVMTRLSSAKSKSRDGKRVSDIAQIQLALELYFDRCNVYPVSIANTSSSCGVATLSQFIATIPRDPLGTNYEYQTDDSTNGTPGPTDYVLKATLENNNAVLQDDVDPTYFGIECADDSTNFRYCVMPR